MCKVRISEKAVRMEVLIPPTPFQKEGRKSALNARRRPLVIKGGRRAHWRGFDSFGEVSLFLWILLFLSPSPLRRQTCGVHVGACVRPWCSGAPCLCGSRGHICGVCVLVARCVGVVVVDVVVRSWSCSLFVCLRARLICGVHAAVHCS